jgi:hypothetical protein
VENSEEPRPEHGQDQDLALKRAIEPDDQGRSSSRIQPAGAVPQVSIGAEDLRRSSTVACC